MFTPLQKYWQKTSTRLQLGVFFAGLIIGGVFYASVLVGEKAPNEGTKAVGEVAVATSTADGIEKSGPVLATSTPVRLRIPALSIDAPFTEPLGLTATGEAVVPKGYEEVGWYKYGPTPGAYGPAVIFGHVDSYQGPAIFFYLGQLKPGDDVYVDRADGSSAHFKVLELKRYPQSDFPTAAVYGDLPYAGLRLITCSGNYERGVQRYSHNLVVYARLVE